MASQSNTTIDSETIALIYASAEVIPVSYCNTAVAVFVIYDWAVTLTREVQLVWTRKARPLSAALYFSNRYLNMIGQVLSMVMLWYDWMPAKGCTGTMIASLVITSSYTAPPAVFSGLRAYALTQRRWLSALVFLLSSIPFVANLMRVAFNISAVQLPFVGCVYSTTFPSFLPPIFTIMDRVSTILADTILIIITWKRVMPYGLMQASRQIKLTKIEGLASVLLRDGMLYFVVLLCLNIIQLVLTELSVELDDHSSLVGLFTGSVSSVLVSHFLLDLQEAHQRKAVGLAIDDPSHALQSLSICSVKFMPALGSLAATIDPADYDREDGNDAVDDNHSEVSDDVPTRSDGGQSTGSARVEDGLTITEVGRSGHSTLAIGP